MLQLRKRMYKRMWSLELAGYPPRPQHSICLCFHKKATTPEVQHLHWLQHCITESPPANDRYNASHNSAAARCCALSMRPKPDETEKSTHFIWVIVSTRRREVWRKHPFVATKIRSGICHHCGKRTAALGSTEGLQPP